MIYGIYLWLGRGVCVMALALGLAACGGDDRGVGPVALVAQPSVVSAASSSVPSSAVPSVKGEVSVDDVVRLALAAHPVTQAGAAIREQAQAQMLQARAWSNPEIEVGLGQSRARDGGDSSGIGGVSLAQRIELPGRRSPRLSAATLAGHVGLAEYAYQQLIVEGEIRRAFVDLDRARKGMTIADEGEIAVQEVLSIVEQRVAAGEARRTDLLRARSAASLAQLAREDAKRELATSSAALTAWCGGGLPDHLVVETPPLAAIPSVLEIEQSLSRHPHIVGLQALVNQRQAEFASERATTTPDVILGVFADREADTDDVGMTLGLELPLWNRNAGGRAAAAAGVAQAEAELASVRLSLSQEALRARDAATAALARSTRYRSELGPAAEETLKLTMLAYQGNETGILDLLEALRTAQEARIELLAAEHAAGLAVISLQQANGTFTANPGVSP